MWNIFFHSLFPVNKGSNVKWENFLYKGSSAGYVWNICLLVERLLIGLLLTSPLWNLYWGWKTETWGLYKTKKKTRFPKPPKALLHTYTLLVCSLFSRLNRMEEQLGQCNNSTKCTLNTHYCYYSLIPYNIMHNAVCYTLFHVCVFWLPWYYVWLGCSFTK